MTVTDELHKALASAFPGIGPPPAGHVSISDSWPTLYGFTIELDLPEDWTFTPPQASGVSRSDVLSLLEIAHSLLNWVEARCEPDCGTCAAKRTILEGLERKLGTGEGQPAWKATQGPGEG